MVREAQHESSVEIDKANEGLHLLLFEGIGQSATPSIFTGSISTLLCEIITPRYSILLKLTFLRPEVEHMLTHAV
jgi:hypothetical protein